MSDRSYQSPGESHRGSSVMEVFVVFIDDRQPHSVKVRENDTIGKLKRAIHMQLSIPIQDQDLMYIGKRLSFDDHLLEHYHIGPGATIHCARNSSQSQSLLTKLMKLSQSSNETGVSDTGPGSRHQQMLGSSDVQKLKSDGSRNASVSPRPKPTGVATPDIDLPLLSKEETENRINYWRNMSTIGAFDADTHIVDPMAHYCMLKYLEESVVKASEYFQCGGNYHCEDNALPDLSWQWQAQWAPNMMRGLVHKLPENFNPARPGIAIDGVPEEQWILQSLWKSYVILCRTLASLERLQVSRFCTDFYSMLVAQPSTKNARLVRIALTELEGLKTGLESAIVQIFDRVPDGFEFVLQAFVATQCDNILNSIGLFPETNSPLPIMAICRITVLLLDLALVSYVGSHGSRFTSYLESSAETIEISCESLDLPIFDCTLSNLACLRGFLDESRVWVFQCNNAQVVGRSGKPHGLTILTRIEEFTDIWGPVWAVPAGRNHPGRIRQYCLSRGVIQPVPGPLSEGYIDCHWFSSSVYSSADSGVELSMGPNDILSIGAALIENTDCLYTLENYEDDFGQVMGFLGTISESWRVDTRTLGFTAGQYLTLTANGTQKKLPGVTLKESIWNKISRDPKNANIEFLNDFLGVEVSHCTGNARRIKMKDMLCLPRVRARLTQYYPEWEQTPWGMLFSRALLERGFDGVRELWRSQRDMREEIGKLIAQLLELLHLTGQQGDCLVAAYLGNYADRHMGLENRGNEWTKCLRDSTMLATYAVVGDVCLKYPTRDNFTATCPRDPAETVFETRILVREDLLSETDYIRLQPTGDLFGVERIRRHRITLLPISGQLAMRMFYPVTRVGSEVVARIGPGRSQKEFSALIRASTKSFGGTRIRRQKAQQLDQAPPGPNNPYNQQAPPMQPSYPFAMETVVLEPSPRRAQERVSRNQRQRTRRDGGRRRSDRTPKPDPPARCVIL